MYLWIPWIGPLEAHPFTIATPYQASGGCNCNQIQFAICVRGGFSKRINNYAMKHPNNALMGLVTGPLGAPPAWEAYESLILISASTGASYTLPILEETLLHSTNTCTKRLSFLLSVKDRCHIEYYEERLKKALAHAKAVGIELDIEIAITGEGFSDAGKGHSRESKDGYSSVTTDESRTLMERSKPPQALVQSVTSSSTSVSSRNEPFEAKACSCDLNEKSESEGVSACCCGSAQKMPKTDAQIIYSYSRPNIAAFIRRTVEITGGETSIAVCGGKSLVSTVRNSVVSLSDERAVHKGTGAQGIHLYVEEYCF